MNKSPLVWLCASAMLAGCASRPIESVSAVPSAEETYLPAPVQDAVEPAETYGLDQFLLDSDNVAATAGRNYGSNVAFDREAIFDQSSSLAQRTFYFDYDRDTLNDQYLDAITDHGRYLSAYADVVVRLEGHADERGTREYNIALAERRAQAVKRLLMLQGASYNQVITISYGEEQPAVLGQTEAARAKNRRVELVYE